MVEEMTEAAATRFDEEIRRGERYGFGSNWIRFLELMNEERIERACRDLQNALRIESLSGKTFLDVGSGSGLSSLAAVRLGATVTSLDYDPESVQGTTWLRDKFAPDCASWKILRGSVLDDEFMESLPSADVVYSWGVLHHTGDMYGAIRLAANRVGPDGLFCIALYRQTIWDPLWKVEKRLYSRAPEFVRGLVRAAWVLKSRIACAMKGLDFAEVVRDYGKDSNGRGMDYYRDIDDWLGGYPYEAILPSQCRSYVGALGFELVHESIVGEGPFWSLSAGCDEWLFRRRSAPVATRP